MPSFNLGTRTLTGRSSFQAQYTYNSDTDTLIIRQTDGNDFPSGRLIMDQDTTVSSNKSLLVSTATANVSNVSLSLIEESARVTALVDSVEVMRFKPPSYITDPVPGPAGAPRSEALPPAPAPAVTAAAPLPLPSVNLNAIRAGGALINAADASVVYINDAPNYTTGLYIRKSGSWLTMSGFLVSGVSV